MSCRGCLHWDGRWSQNVWNPVLSREVKEMKELKVPNEEILKLTINDAEVFGEACCRRGFTVTVLRLTSDESVHFLSRNAWLTRSYFALVFFFFFQYLFLSPMSPSRRRYSYDGVAGSHHVWAHWRSGVHCSSNGSHHDQQMGGRCFWQRRNLWGEENSLF